jgi:hypothetical protein
VLHLLQPVMAETATGSSICNHIVSVRMFDSCRSSYVNGSL